MAKIKRISEPGLRKLVDHELEGIDDLKENHPLYKLVNSRELTEEHYKSPPIATLGMLYRNLKQYTIGQDRAVFDISLVIANHIFHLNNPQVYYRKVNPLLIGPTGTGKTSTIREAAKIVGLPFVEFSLAQVTPLGIAGGLKLPQALGNLIYKTDINLNNTIVERLHNAKRINDRYHDYLIENGFDPNDEVFQNVSVIAKIYSAEHGIIFMDEVDKKAYSGKPNELGIKEDVQNELLEYLGGSKIRFGERDGVEPEYVGKEIDTSNILFFLAGAFSELYNENEDLSPKEVIKYGLKPELMSRAGVPIIFRKLDKDDYYRILTERPSPEDGTTMLEGIIAQVKNYYPLAEFTDDVVNYIVDETISSDLGARYLINISQSLASRIINYLFQTAGFYQEEKPIVIDKQFLKPIVEVI